MCVRYYLICLLFFWSVWASCTNADREGSVQNFVCNTELNFATLANCKFDFICKVGCSMSEGKLIPVV